MMKNEFESYSTEMHVGPHAEAAAVLSLPRFCISDEKVDRLKKKYLQIGLELQVSY
jgi:hypothetical protein